MEKIIEEFLEMVKLGGASRDERAVADYLTKKLEELGCSVFEDDAGERAGGNTGNFCCKVFTMAAVPSGEPSSMTRM